METRLFPYSEKNHSAPYCPMKIIKQTAVLCFMIVMFAITLFLVAGFGRCTLFLVKGGMKDAGEIMQLARKFKPVAVVVSSPSQGLLDFSAAYDDYEPTYGFSEPSYDPDYSKLGEYQHDPVGSVGESNMSDPRAEDDLKLPQGSYRE